MNSKLLRSWAWTSENWIEFKYPSQASLYSHNGSCQYVQLLISTNQTLALNLIKTQKYELQLGNLQMAARITEKYGA